MPTSAESPLYEKIIAWLALTVFAPMYLPDYFVGMPLDYALIGLDYVEKFTFAIPYYVSQYAATLVGFYTTTLGVYLISLIQGAISA